MSLKRFFLDRDNSGHWYVVPAARRKAWNTWLDLPEDEEAGWEAPKFAVRLNGGPYNLTFSQPEDL